MKSTTWSEIDLDPTGTWDEWICAVAADRLNMRDTAEDIQEINWWLQKVSDGRIDVKP